MEIDDTVVLGIFGVALIAYVANAVKRLEAELKELTDFSKNFQAPDFDFDEIREDIGEIVEEFLSSVKMPSMGDTLLQYGAGFIANKFGIGAPFVNPQPQLDILEPESEEVWHESAEA